MSSDRMTKIIEIISPYKNLIQRGDFTWLTEEASQYRKRVASEDLCKLFTEAQIPLFADTPIDDQKPLALTAQDLVPGFKRWYTDPPVEMIRFAKAIGLEVYKADHSKLRVERSADLYTFVHPGRLLDVIRLTNLDERFLQLTSNDLTKI